MRRPPLACSEHALARWALRTGRDPQELAQAWHEAVFVGQVRGRHHRVLFGYRVGSVVILVRYRGPRRHQRPQWAAISVWAWPHWARWRDKTEAERAGEH